MTGTGKQSTGRDSPAEHLDSERLDSERLDSERLDSECLDSERLDSERLDSERLNQRDVNVSSDGLWITLLDTIVCGEWAFRRLSQSQHFEPEVAARPALLLGVLAAISGVLLYMEDFGAQWTFWPDQHYLIQAVVAVPWVLASWWLGAAAAGALARWMGTTVTQNQLRYGWGLALCAPLLLIVVGPEILVLILAGTYETTGGLRVYSSPAAILVFALGFAWIRTLTGLSTARSWLVSGAGMAVSLGMLLLVFR